MGCQRPVESAGLACWRRYDAQFGGEDGAVHGVQVARVKGRAAAEHLEDERAEGPPVDRHAVAHAEEHLV